MSRSGGPTIPPVTESIDPSVDLYGYVNRAWMRKTTIPSFAGSFGVSEEIEERVRGVIMEDVQRLIRSDPDHPVSRLAKSALNAQIQDNNVRDMRHLLQTFSCMRTTEDVAREIGRLNRIQVRAPITFAVNADTYKSAVCRVHIYEPTLGLPAKHYYNTANGSNRVVLQYGSMMKKIGGLLETESLESVVSIETSIIPFLSEGDSLSDPTESYADMSLKELEKEYPAVPWFTMFEGWGMPSDLIRRTTFILTNERYAKGFNRMFKTFDMDAWRVWLRAGVVLSLIEYMPPPFDDLHYELFGKRLRGNVQKLPQKLLTLRVLQTFATQALSRLFVEKSVDESVKEEATTMVRRLKTATIHRIRKVSWMTAKTKETAVEKIKAMRIQVAYPSVWYNEFNGLNMDSERLIHNIIGLCVRDTDRTIKTIGPGCGETDGTWDDGAFDVNAYYYPDRNQLTIPAGMLRSPFFDQRRGAAWNYGGIGSAVGHEITHGFDADGKNFDLRGSFKDWWTKSDNEAYTRMTKGLVALFNGQEYAGGRVDGNLTLSENIADLGGMAIALDALHEYLDEKKASAAEKKRAYRDFFTSYAVSWRNKDRPKKAKQSLYLDVHAPAPLRVNLIVRQFAEFYEAFNLGPDSPGWIAPEERIQLW
jgi:putative endopeptidase